MDWVGIVIAVAAIAAGAAFVGLMVKGASVWVRRPRKPSRIRRVKGEYQPPEPPVGRYWG